MTKFILVAVADTGSNSQLQELKFKCEDCGEVKLSHQLGKHAYIHHGAGVVEVDTTAILKEKK